MTFANHDLLIFDHGGIFSILPTEENKHITYVQSHVPKSLFCSVPISIDNPQTISTGFKVFEDKEPQTQVKK